MRHRPVYTNRQWPIYYVASIMCRQRDLVIRIADYTTVKSHPGYDVEVYKAGWFAGERSASFTLEAYGRDRARLAAIEYAQQQVASGLSVE